MSSFCELLEPNHTNGTIPTLWFVSDLYGNRYLLNDGSGLGYVNGPNSKPLKNFYFKSQEDAFTASVNFYNNHMKYYPHGDAMMKVITILKDRSADSNSMELVFDANASLVVQVESQVMEFE